jgi:hypothetical protein
VGDRPGGPAPAAVAFGIRGVTLDPAAGSFRVQFVTSEGEPARLDVLDVAGRRVATAGIEHGAAGAGTATLDAPRALASGVYFVRLSQGGRRDVRRALVIR